MGVEEKDRSSVPSRAAPPKPEAPDALRPTGEAGFLKRFFLDRLADKNLNFFKLLFLLRKIYLTSYRKIHYSQFAEDAILKAFIPKNRNTGFFVDVGCYHPKKYSNTYKLYKRGWRGINIDLDQIKIDAFNLVRSGDHNVMAAISDESRVLKQFKFGHYSLVSTIDEKTARTTRGQVTHVQEIRTRTLDEVIADSPFRGQRIDLLSIDTEGHDLQVLKSLSFDTYQPRVVLVETHLKNLDQVLESEVHRFLVDKKYKMINWVGFTLFYALENNGLTLPHIP